MQAILYCEGIFSNICLGKQKLQVSYNVFTFVRPVSFNQVMGNSCWCVKDTRSFREDTFIRLLKGLNITNEIHKMI